MARFSSSFFDMDEFEKAKEAYEKALAALTLEQKAQVAPVPVPAVPKLTGAEAKKKYRDLIRRFDGGGKGVSIEAWQAGVDLLLADDCVAEPDKVNIILSSLGDTAYTKAHAVGHTVGTSEEIVQNLKQVYGGSEEIEGKAAEFYALAQLPTESITDFFLRLREAAFLLSKLHLEKKVPFDMGNKLVKQLIRGCRDTEVRQHVNSLDLLIQNDPSKLQAALKSFTDAQKERTQLLGAAEARAAQQAATTMQHSAEP